MRPTLNPALIAALCLAVSSLAANAQAPWNPATATPLRPGSALFALDPQFKSLSIPPQAFTTLIQSLIVAHSYLQGIDLASEEAVTRRLMEGECKSAEPCKGKSTWAFAQIPAANFFQDFEFVRHVPNDRSGYSATLLRGRQTKQFILAIRGRETPPAAESRDIDADTAAVREVFTLGMAVAQTSSAEHHVRRWQDEIPDFASSKVVLAGADLGAHVAMNLMVLIPGQFQLAFVSSPMPQFGRP